MGKNSHTFMRGQASQNEIHLLHKLHLCIDGFLKIIMKNLDKNNLYIANALFLSVFCLKNLDIIYLLIL